MVSAAVTTSKWSFNHLKVAPCPLPRPHRSPLPPHILVGHTAPDMLAEQFPPLSQGMLLVSPFPTASITAGGQRGAAQPPVLWGQPPCPGSAHHPLCYPNTASHRVPHGKSNSCPLSHAVRLCSSTRQGTQARLCQAGTSLTARSPRSREKGELLPQPHKWGVMLQTPSLPG